MSEALDSGLEKYLPLTEPMYYMMLAFHKPMHGYGAMKFVESTTEGRLHIVPGTLYGLITKMCAQGLIEQVEAGRIVDTRRKEYLLTSRGRELLAYEFRRITDMAREGAEVIFTMRGMYDDM